MNNKAKSGFLQANPEKLMIVLFPLITLALFIAGAIAWWLITSNPA